MKLSLRQLLFFLQAAVIVAVLGLGAWSRDQHTVDSVADHAHDTSDPSARGADNGGGPQPSRRRR